MNEPSSLQRAQAGRPAELPEPISLETLELVEQALGDALRALRRRAAGPSGREAGELEYASWRRWLQ
jgi:hypothetical protein